MKFWEMSEEERVKAITEHVRRHWHDRGCPMCLQTDWTMTEGYTRLDMSEFGQRFAQIGGRAVLNFGLIKVARGMTADAMRFTFLPETGWRTFRRGGLVYERT